MGGAFMNYFNRFGRQWQVYVQADGDYRTQRRKHRPVLRSKAKGNMFRCPPSHASRRDRTGVHDALQRLPLRADHRTAAPGYSSAQARRALEETSPRPCRPIWATTTSACRSRRSWQRKVFRPWSCSAFRCSSSSSSSPRSTRAGRSLQRAAHDAGRRARRIRRARDPRNAERCLRPDRPGHAHRPVGQECDPDRRIREAGLRDGQPARSRRHSSGARMRFGRFS